MLLARVAMTICGWCAAVIITTRQCLERNIANRSIRSVTFNSYEMLI
jgi:hypothetical protein